VNLVFIRQELSRFLAEDLGHVEIAVQPNTSVCALITAESAGILCGGTLVAETFRLLDAGGERVEVASLLADGASFTSGQELVRLTMPGEILRYGIRTALNLLQHLSGIATHTHDLVSRVPSTCRLLDTRKTTPGLRVFEKYAVRTGGGRNHRFGRSDGVMIKKEDIAIDGGITPAITRALKEAAHLTAIEIEVETLDDLETVLQDGRVRHGLLDNMSPDLVRACVVRAGERLILEASGVQIADVERYAETGVPFISTSDLVRGARALPMHLRMRS
jgi:nicotinate-nucleotide pyrophosphorylase (carboxylating)